MVYGIYREEEVNMHSHGEIVFGDDGEIKSYDFSDFFNPKITDYKQKMIENLEELLKQLKNEQCD